LSRIHGNSDGNHPGGLESRGAPVWTALVSRNFRLEQVGSCYELEPIIEFVTGIFNQALLAGIARARACSGFLSIRF
jgi:hypothetical protein